MRRGAILLAAVVIVTVTSALRAQAPQPAESSNAENREYYQLRKVLLSRGQLNKDGAPIDVYFRDSTFQDALYRQLAKFPTIRALDLSHSAITDEGIATFGALQSLEYLILTRTHVTDRGLQALKDLPKLKLLYLNSLPITDAGLLHLEGLPLEELHLFGTSVTAKGLKSLSAMKSLKILSIANTKITFEEFEAAGPEGITTLYLDTLQFRGFMPERYFQTVFAPEVSYRFERNGFAADLFYAANDDPPAFHGVANQVLLARGLPQFEGARIESPEPRDSVVIRSSTELDALLENLDHLLHLRRLTIRQASLAEAAFVGRSARRLVFLDLTGTDATDGLFARSSEFDNLETLHLGDTQVGDEALASLRQTRLGSLSLSRTRVTDAGVATLAKFAANSLHDLQLDFTRVTDQAMPDLEQCQDLRVLNLRGTGIGDKALPSIGKLTRLETLDLELTRVTDAGLAGLSKVAHLKSLNLANTAITDAGLRKLAGCQSLKQIDLRDTKVTAVGIAWLQLKFPQIQILE